eukprot:CAMPEP_0202442866 /NCGR_PEP_ID=MMETSP1360-20130828/2224_1 /ASSEMBLY_ACC=CAM_ASM_000848 /TAXON_ID=515479 /ORGANISM="Licmophora paradoxa, Strain CCMP2313" /LENGTH=437 /DNA_ID=CAMNT_0049058357 /DNA_START=122 /DNA_END=1435 /DNA_ORIENTATION=+
MASDEMMAYRGPAYAKNNQRRRFLIIGALVVIVTIIVVSTVATKDRKEAEAAAREADEVAEDRGQLRQLINVALDHVGIDSGPIDIENSYQSDAFKWLSSDQDLANYQRSEVVQRFALACFFYATNSINTLYTPSPRPWKQKTNWLSNQNECSWQGIQCSSSKKVNRIILEKNYLSGNLPFELALLRDHLLILSLTGNQLFIEGTDWDVFTKLTNLEQILIDDNFLSSARGIPSSLGHCTRLQKLRLSYNLIGGPIDGPVLRDLTQLTHLEIESNFLEGTIPDTIGRMEQLAYLYLRRNDLHSSLDFLKTRKLNNLFALWLDANKIVGTIPTEIGLCTDLASISISNGTLTGTIPTEIGHMKGLRRVWLYGNALTGTIPTEVTSLKKLEVFELHRNLLSGNVPQSVCDTIAVSNYTHKSLIVDCAKVVCEGCCTRCE